ncbi:glycosyltransferase [Candidatus Dependentiae bacterium]|nr:glycosyltransferase [Candidatus Dependentiae bacterium]
MMKTKKLFLVAAGSGGHILPALVLGKAWQENNPDGKIIFFSSSRTLDQTLVTQTSIAQQSLFFRLGTLSMRTWWKLPILLAQLLYIFGASFWHALRLRPEKIICTGGLIGLPVCLAGRLAGILVEIYELNAVPGKAVKALMPVAHTIFTPFAQTSEHYALWGKSFATKCKLTSYPLRFGKKIKKLEPQIVFDQLNAQTSKEFSLNKKTILIVGGSQGSAFLNRCIQDLIARNSFPKNQIQIIHQAGSSNLSQYRTWYQEQKIAAYVFDFDPQIDRYYQVADLIICRAGAGTLFEIAHFGKKSIIIPLIASTTTHQKDNAFAIATEYPNLFTALDQQTLELDLTPLEQTVLARLNLHS